MKALGFISVPIYTRLFAPDEYSVLAFVTTLGGLFAALLALGGDTTLARFWFEDESLPAQRRLVRTWIGFLALWALALCLVLAPFTPGIAALALDPSAATVFLLMLAVLPVSLVSRMLAQILRNQFRPSPYALTSFGVGVSGLLGGLAAVVLLDLGVAGILLGMLGAELVVLLVRMVLVRRMLAGGRFDRRLLGGLLRFGAPLVPVTLSFWVFTASDRVVLGKLGDLTELGYYSLGVSLVSVFALLSGALGQSWLPRIIQLYQHDEARAARVIGVTLTYLVFGLGFLAVLMSAFAAELVRLVAAPAYAPASRVIPLLTLGAVAYGSNLLTASGMTMRQRTRPLALLSGVAAVINLALAVTLVPILGMVGAALASALGYAVLTCSYLGVSQRLWPVPLERRRLAVASGALVAVAVLLTALPELPVQVRGALPAVYLASLLVFGGSTPLDRQLLGRLRQRLPSLHRSP
jgi:O-antigen/teichoic acid export membrane protein